MWIGVDMMMQGQGTVKTSWQAVDEWCICVRIVAMWSGSIREGFRGYVSNLGIECTVTVVATPPPPPPPHPLTRQKQPMVGCGVFAHAGSKLEVRD